MAIYYMGNIKYGLYIRSNQVILYGYSECPHTLAICLRFTNMYMCTCTYVQACHLRQLSTNCWLDQQTKKLEIQYFDYVLFVYAEACVYTYRCYARGSHLSNGHGNRAHITTLIIYLLKQKCACYIINIMYNLYFTTCLQYNYVQTIICLLCIAILRPLVSKIY